GIGVVSLPSSLFVHSSISSVARRSGADLVEVAPAPDGGSPRRLVGSAVRNSSFEAADAADQLAGRTFGLDNLSLELAAPVGVPRRSLRLALEARDQIAQVLLDGVDLFLEARERPLDLLDGAVLGHHPLDRVDAADDVRRVDAARTAVLPLAPDPDRSGQKAKLHVLAQRRLGEADPARLEDVDDLA